MKLPEFKQSEVRWDAYRAFHIHHDYNGYHDFCYGSFVQFDTGEVICTVTKPRLEKRRIYRTLNIQIVGTNDYDCPQLYTLEGEKIPFAWLNSCGSQALLLDLDNQHLVRLSGESLQGVPSRFVHVPAYYPGPGRLPVGSSISVGRPYKWDKAEREHIRSLVAAAKVKVKFDELPPIWPRRYARLDPVALLSREWGSFNTLELKKLAQNHIWPRRDVTHYQYLVTKEGLTESSSPSPSPSPLDTWKVCYTM